jgi:hypothetical protein
MTDNFTEDHLTKVTVPAVELKRHQQALRRALLASSHWAKKPSLLSNFVFLFWKGSDKNMNYKRLALSGVVVAVLVAGVLAMSIIWPGNSTAHAKELAQKSLQTVSQLSTEEKAKREISVDTEDLLKEAQNAKDLTVLTYDQVKDMLPQESEPGVITHENCPEEGSEEGGVITHENHPEKGAGEGAEPEKVLVMCGKPSKEDLEKLEQAKFLRFTSSQGLKVLMGIDQDNLPIFTLAGFGQ